MAINATYGLNTYLSAVINTAGYGTLTFAPGSFAGQGVADNYVVYNVLPSTGFDYFFIHNDQIIYKVYHTKFDTLKKIEDTIITSLNVDNIQSVTALTESGVKYLATHAQVTDSGESIYIKGNDYFTSTIQTMLVYSTP